MRPTFRVIIFYITYMFIFHIDPWWQPFIARRWLENFDRPRRHTPLENGGRMCTLAAGCGVCTWMGIVLFRSKPNWKRLVMGRFATVGSRIWDVCRLRSWSLPLVGIDSCKSVPGMDNKHAPTHAEMHQAEGGQNWLLGVHLAIYLNFPSPPNNHILVVMPICCRSRDTHTCETTPPHFLSIWIAREGSKWQMFVSRQYRSHTGVH